MPVLGPEQERFLFALACRITPECASLDEAGRREFFALVDRALASRPAKMQGQFKLFLKVLRLSTLPTHLRPLDRLAGPAQDRVLRRFESSGIGLLRMGFWGLKAMVFMGYYGRSGVGPSLGYTPTKNGNEVLLARA